MPQTKKQLMANLAKARKVKALIDNGATKTQARAVVHTKSATGVKRRKRRVTKAVIDNTANVYLPIPRETRVYPGPVPQQVRGLRGEGVLGDVWNWTKKSANNLAKNTRIASNTVRGLAGASKTYGGVVGTVGGTLLDKGADWLHSKGYGRRHY